MNLYNILKFFCKYSYELMKIIKLLSNNIYFLNWNLS